VVRGGYVIDNELIMCFALMRLQQGNLYK